jgi:hypothetical protein
VTHLVHFVYLVLVLPLHLHCLVEILALLGRQPMTCQYNEIKDQTIAKLFLQYNSMKKLSFGS